jgi:ATP-dependent DNA ligase
VSDGVNLKGAAQYAGVNGAPTSVGDYNSQKLPEKKAGRWGAGLTAAKMVECRWLKPQLVGHFEFVEWTSEGHLRHSKFVRLLEDQKANDVAK